MNVDEFSALKVGDKVQNGMLMNEPGTVCERTPHSVKIKWGNNNTPYTYLIVGTAWFHWVKVEDAPPAEAKP
jgi:hypothetical protein